MTFAQINFIIFILSFFYSLLDEASAQMDLDSKITGKRNYSSSSSSSSLSKSTSSESEKNNLNQIQNTNHFSTSSINADNSIYPTNGQNSKSIQVKKYQTTNSNVKDSHQMKNNIAPNDGHFDNSPYDSFNFVSQVLPSSVACCWKVIVAIFAIISLTILIVSCLKICQNYLCCCCLACNNKRPPSPVPMTVSSITASHSLLETNSWEK